MTKRKCIVLFLILISISFQAQRDSLSPNTIKKRKWLITAGSAGLSAGSLLYLQQAWYSQHNTGSFHFFNDNKEWLQMDKVGHVYSAYTMGRLMMDAFDWAGYTKNQKLFIGNSIGFVYLTGIEVLDGFSRGWGFSWGDMLANTLGSGASASQEALWNGQRIWLKFSYYESGYAPLNPGLLGNNLSERILKDYNGQIYWLSFNPFVVAGVKSKIPEWLNLSLGYGASGMLRSNGPNVVTEYHPDGSFTQYEYKIDRARNFYLSLDIDFTRIKTKSKALKTVFTCINSLKVPLPALMFNNKGNQFYFAR